MYCDCCKHGIHKKIANLSLQELHDYLRKFNNWFCMQCLYTKFPFSNVSNDELIYHCFGIDDDMVELYEECTDLNFQPFNYTENNEYFLGDNADQDINFYNRLQVDSRYYTDDQFNGKLSCRKQGSEYFFLIYYNCRSIVKNFYMLKDHVTTLDVMFDVIALLETWLNDNSSDTVNLDGYDLVSCPRSSKKGGVGLYIKKFITTQIPPLLSKSIDNC